MIGRKKKRSRILPLFYHVTMFSNSILAPKLEAVYLLIALVQESCCGLDQDIRADPRIEELELSKVRCLCADRLVANLVWGTNEISVGSFLQCLD